MIAQRLIISLVLIIFIRANPIEQYNNRHRRSLDLTNWQSAHLLFKHLYLINTQTPESDTRIKRAEVQAEHRPVEGPINIEQLPAMLAARNVKRYPYSQQDDPAVIGR